MLDSLMTSEYEEEVLKLIDNRDYYTRSDLQGVVAALVSKIMERGYKLINHQEKMKGKV